MVKKILALPGDGVGQEVIPSAIFVINAATEDVDISFGDIGTVAYNKTDNYLPPETMDIAMEADAIIAGEAVKRPNDMTYRDPLKVLKKQLNLYCVLRKYYPLCERLSQKDVDLIIVTENPSSLLNVIEKENINGVVAEKFIANESCKKIFRKTLEIATLKQRKAITCVHRSEMFPHSDEVFVDLFYKEMAASDFNIGDDEAEHVASRLVSNPSSFDVLVCVDQYGSILASEAAGLVGGIHLTPMGSIGDMQGLFEPMHGPSPKVAEGFANPTSAILSGAMAMDHIGMPLVGEEIRSAVREIYKKGIVTPDVGGSATGKEFTDAVIDAIISKK